MANHLNSHFGRLISMLTSISALHQLTRNQLISSISSKMLNSSRDSHVASNSQKPHPFAYERRKSEEKPRKKPRKLHIECLQNLKRNWKCSSKRNMQMPRFNDPPQPPQMHSKIQFSSLSLCLRLFILFVIISRVHSHHKLAKKKQLIINYNNEMEHGIACLKKLLSLSSSTGFLFFLSLIACIVSLLIALGGWWCLWLLQSEITLQRRNLLDSTTKEGRTRSFARNKKNIFRGGFETKSKSKSR